MQFLPVQDDSVVSECVNVWRRYFRTPVEANIVEAEIVRHNYHNIRLQLISSAAKAAQCKTHC